MYKKVLKGVLVCVSVVFFTLVVGYLMYMLTLNTISGNLNENISSANSAQSASTQTVPIEESPDPSPTTLQTEYYMAKLNGSAIEVYLCDDGKEGADKKRYLYSFGVYVSDIPSDDLDILKQGVKLKSREELASFEEDYNS